MRKSRIDKRVVILVALALLVGSSFTSVLGDSVEGFDNYPTGSASSNLPLPWQYYSPTPSCWSSISSPNLPDTGVSTLPNPKQPDTDATTSTPNTFEFNFAPACSNTATTASISIQVNATGPTLFLSWYQSMLSVCVSGDTGCSMPVNSSTANSLQPNVVTFEMLINNVVEYSNDTSSMALCQCWNQVLNTVGIPVVDGSINTITFEMTTSAYTGGGYSFSFALDTINFGNANPIVMNSGIIPNYNLVLQNYPTDQWFNISKYQESQISINYNQSTQCTTSSSASSPFIIGAGEPVPSLATQGSTCILTNLSYPDIYVPNLGYASLITANVGGVNVSSTTSYIRTIIPCVNPLEGVFSPDINTCGQTYAQNGSSYAGVQRIYLNNPTRVTQYSISVDDLSGIYNVEGTQIFIYEGGPLNATLISSGYIDSQGTYPVALVPSSYIAILRTSTGAQYETTINAGTTSSSLVISIGNVNFNVSSNVNSVTLGAGLSCSQTSLIVGYSDQSALTTAVTFTLENYTMSGILVVNSTTTDMSIGTTALYFTFSGINSSQASYYLVQANATRSDGLDAVLGPVPITSEVTGCNGLPSSFPKTPILPNTIFGLNQILPNPLSAMQLLAFGFIMILSLSMGARAAKLGVIFVVGLSIIFTMAGWLPLQTFYASVFMVGSITVFLLSRARRNSPY